MKKSRADRTPCVDLPLDLLFYSRIELYRVRKHSVAKGMRKISDTLEDMGMKAVDLAFALVPRKAPLPDSLRNCKVVAHRGDHDNLRCMENTVPAFDRALEGGVWGMEFDVRWTRDHHPVVYHDASLARLHGKPLYLADLSLVALQGRFPMIPTLEEVVGRYGGKIHLMIELKKESWFANDRRKSVLRTLLSCLQPVEEFHVLGLSPEVFAMADFLPPRTFVAVGTRHVRQMSEIALKNDWGGFAGHYLLLSDAILRRHRKSGQKVGTGHAGSRNVLYRELNRGVDWIFSNNAVELQSVCMNI